MNGLRVDGQGPRRARTFHSALDALVAEETEALFRRKEGRPTPPKPAAPPQHRAEPGGQEPPPFEPTTLDALAQVADDAPGENGLDGGRVVGLARLRAREKVSMPLPFSPAEEAFIERAAAFLRQRTHADLIIDEIWSLLPGEAEPAEEDFPYEAAESDGEADGAPAEASGKASFPAQDEGEAPPPSNAGGPSSTPGDEPS